MRMLLVEDDEVLAASLMMGLASRYYVIDLATDGQQGWEYAQATTYDLVVLDVDLPRISGVQLCQRLRQHQYQGPVLLLTARGETDDKVQGLDAGADDYVVKPCSLEELCARIRALLRRQGTLEGLVLEWGDLCLDPITCLVTYQDQPLTLSPKEYALLELLLRNPQRVFSSHALLEHLWTFEAVPGEETVRAHVKRLRHKLRGVGAADLIETVYGMGYRLRPLPEVSDPTPTLAEIRQKVAASWPQFQPLMQERVAILEQAIAALENHSLSESLQAQARQAAHKLAGSLGMFGYEAATQLARQIEQWFGQPGEELAWLKRSVANLAQGIQRCPNGSQPERSTAPTMPTPSSRHWRLLVVDNDREWTEQLQAAGEAGEWQIQRVSDLAQAAAWIRQAFPDGVLLDPSCSTTSQAHWEWLEGLTTQFPHLPVVVISMQDQLDVRLAAARRGQHTFVSKRMTPERVLEIVAEKLDRRDHRPTQVMAVVNDPQLLAVLDPRLKEGSIVLTTVADPYQFWLLLEPTAPDLLIFEADMRPISGLELCQIVRNDPTWGRLPIVLLASHCNADTLHHLYRAGADYVSSQFTLAESLTPILTRLPVVL